MGAHLLLSETNVGNPGEEQIDTLQDLIQLANFLLCIRFHGVEYEFGLDGWLRRSRD